MFAVSRRNYASQSCKECADASSFVAVYVLFATSAFDAICIGVLCEAELQPNENANDPGCQGPETTANLDRPDGHSADTTMVVAIEDEPTRQEELRSIFDRELTPIEAAAIGLARHLAIKGRSRRRPLS